MTVNEIKNEIERRWRELADKNVKAGGNKYDAEIAELLSLLSFIENMEKEEDVKPERPEYGYFETIYHCGKKPRWKVGDKLAYYELETDCEGEMPIGEVIDVRFDEDVEDWLYVLRDVALETEQFEQDLIESEAYKIK